MVFVGMGAVALAAVMLGFGRTYAVPMSRGTFSAPWVVHLHGAFALSWVLLFASQPLFVRYGALRTHKSVGRVALPLAVGVAVTMLPAGVFQATRDAAAGSVGRPKDGDWRAGYVRLELGAAEPHVEFVRVVYDVEAAARGVIDAGLPEEFADFLRIGGSSARA